MKVNSHSTLSIPRNFTLSRTDRVEKQTRVRTERNHKKLSATLRSPKVETATLDYFERVGRDNHCHPYGA